MPKAHYCQGYMRSPDTTTGTRYFTFGANAQNMSEIYYTTETAAQQTIYTDCTVQNARIYISSNTQPSDTYLKLRINGADGNISITITASTTGEFTNDTDTDSLTNGDLVNWLSSASTGGTRLRIVDTIVECEDSNHTKLTVLGNNFFAPSANTTYYVCIGGYLKYNETTETNVSVVTGLAGQLESMFVRLLINTRSSTTTFGTRINGSNGNVTVTAAGSTTGTFSDTSNTDSISIGDTINYYMTTGSGSGNLSLLIMSVDLHSSTPKTQLVFGGTNWSSASDRSASIGGFSSSPEPTNAHVQSRIKYSSRASYLQAYISSCSITALFGADPQLDWIVRKNDVNTDLKVTSLNNATGRFTNTTDTADFEDGDYIHLEQDTNSSGIFDSAITKTVGFVLEDLTAAGPVITPLRSLMGVGT